MGFLDSLGKLVIKFKFKKDNSPTQKITQKNIKGGACAENKLILSNKK